MAGEYRARGATRRDYRHLGSGYRDIGQFLSGFPLRPRVAEKLVEFLNSLHLEAGHAKRNPFCLWNEPGQALVKFPGRVCTKLCTGRAKLRL